MAEIAGGILNRALPVIFGAELLALLGVTPGEIHVLDHRIERVTFALEQFANFIPASERAEGVDVLKEKFASENGAGQGNGIQEALIFSVLIEPGGERGQVGVVSVFQLIDLALLDPRALIGLLRHFRLRRDESVRSLR